MRILSDEEVAKRGPIYISSPVQIIGKPPATGPITASMGRPDSPAPAPRAAAAAPGGGNAQADESFCATVHDLTVKRKLPRSEAIKTAVAERPDLHAQHVNRVNAQADADSFRRTYVTTEPKTFAEAVNLMLGAGHDPREAVRLAAARYPELYQARQRRIAELLK